MNEQVFENPIWEKARKALEAVSPKKAVNNSVDQQDIVNNMQQQNMTPQEMYYHQLNQFKQNQAMPQHPP